MAHIWGLDLHNIQWAKFKSSYMFKNRTWHLRRTKFLVYQLAMIFLVISESLGTAVLSDYLDQQDQLQAQFPGLYLYNNNYIGIASFNIFVGIFAAFVFGAGFFFDLFFPERYEPRWVQNLWMGCAIFTCIAALGDAIAFTVIVCLKSEIIENYNAVDPALLAALGAVGSKSPIVYRQGGRTIASVVLLWFGWVSAILSTIVMIMFYRHVRSTGSARARHVLQNEKAGDFSQEASSEKEEVPASSDDYTKQDTLPAADTTTDTVHDAATLDQANQAGSRHYVIESNRIP